MVDSATLPFPGVAPAPVEVPGQPCNAACRNALSDDTLCRCDCRGRNHGSVHAARHEATRNLIRTRIQRTGDVFLGAAAPVEDEWWAAS